MAPAALTALSERGLGLRRHEGFGDLAPAPVLRDGAAARQQAADNSKRNRERAAPLNRLLARSPWVAAAVVKLMTEHAEGDRAAAGRLRQAARGQGDADVREAMEFFLGLPPEDAAELARELGR